MSANEQTGGFGDGGKQAATGGGATTRGDLVGHDKVGRDKVGADQFVTDTGNVTGSSVIGSKGVRQTVHDGPELTVNNYEPRSNSEAAALEAMIARLEDNMNAKINNLQNNMTWRLELVTRDIADIQRNAGRVWLPLLTVVASVLMAFALFYFGSGLYSLSAEMRLNREYEQRIEIQKNGGLYVKP